MRLRVAHKVLKHAGQWRHRWVTVRRATIKLLGPWRAYWRRRGETP